MFLNPYLFFAGVFAVVICFEYEFLMKTHIQCDAPADKIEYAELFCMARTQNLRAEGHGAYLRNYGRWQFFIIIQMFIAAILCRIDLKMRELSKEKVSTIGKRYVLSTCALTCIIVCWVLTYFSMGRYYNTYISRVFYHAVDRNPVRSPLQDVFPLSADCFVEPMKSNDTYWTNCKLPLNETTPLYFVALFLVYIFGLMWTANLILELAYEKIMETRKNRLRNFEINILYSNELNGGGDEDPRIRPLNVCTERTKQDLLEKLKRKFLLRLKYLTKPHTISSTSPYAPLTKEPI